jgi:hypothetical protein
MEKANQCVNPAKGSEGGIGWEERVRILEQGLDGI